WRARPLGHCNLPFSVEHKSPRYAFLCPDTGLSSLVKVGKIYSAQLSVMSQTICL
ncbi:MAG: hypothetical protein ACJAVL_000291, partial [Bacteroidia bacterium]